MYFGHFIFLNKVYKIKFHAMEFQGRGHKPVHDNKTSSKNKALGRTSPYPICCDAINLIDIRSLNNP